MGKVTGGFTVNATFAVAKGTVLEPDPRRRVLLIPSAAVDIFLILTGDDGQVGYRIPAGTIGLKLTVDDVGYDLTQALRGYSAAGGPVTVGCIVGRV